MDRTAYQQLKDAENRVCELQASIARCDHVFVSEAPRQRVVSKPAYDQWAGPGYASTESYAMVGRRSCTRCGLVQESTSERPGEWAPWKNV